LAAGAAHELSTPLSTIAVVAGELAREIEPLRPEGPLRDDVQLIRDEVRRCRNILDRMAVDAGTSKGESLVPICIDEIITQCMQGLPASPRVHVDVAEPLRGRSLSLPPRALEQALRGVIKNAQDASEGAGEVYVRAHATHLDLQLEVEDKGTGMSPDVAARACEPFFTTKPPGRGMGLGLFLTRLLLEQLGGSFAIDSQPGRGTVATITLPIAAATRERVASHA
jgi:two-component system sensor histidine kinase RegB